MILIKTNKDISRIPFGKSKIDDRNIYQFENFDEFLNEKLKPEEFDYIIDIAYNEELNKLKEYKHKNNN